jgi:hypothetical protein
MYFIEKIGVYGHGVFWIGSDLDEAKKKADEYATLDKDDYHRWNVLEFDLSIGEKPKFSDDSWHFCWGDAAHNLVYTGVRNT